MGKICTDNPISLWVSVIQSLMNKSPDMPEMFIMDTSQNFLSIASQNYFMGEQNQNSAFPFSTSRTKRCLWCITSLQLLKTNPPYVYLIPYSWV